MRWKDGLTLRLRSLFKRAHVERELDAELQFHLDQQIEENLATGMSVKEARSAAVRSLGMLSAVKEQCRDSLGLRLVDEVRQDVRFALRTLVKNPGFTLVAVLTLALGIGTNTAIFSVVDGVLLHPIPFSEPDGLMGLHSTSATTSWSAVSYPNLLDWQRQTRTFEGIAAWRIDFFTLTGRSEAERVMGGRVSANYFSILRVQPLLGRIFRPDEDELGAERVVILGEGLWHRLFGADPRIVGQSITLDGRPHTVIGVMPTYVGLGVISRLYNDVFLPIGQFDDKLFRSRGVYATEGLGRLNPGVTVTEASVEMDTIAKGLAAAYPDVNAGQGIHVIPVKDSLVGDLRPIILLLVGAVGCVLLIACANVANLTLARSSGRAQEFALRVALGATRSRIVRQVLTESVLLSAAGGALGIVLASWGTRAALSVLPTTLPDIVQLGMNPRVLGFALGAIAWTSVLSGVIPARTASHSHLQESLKQGGRGGALRRHSAQQVLVVAEVALTLILLVGAGLMTRSLARLWAVSPGFDPKGVLTFTTGLSPEKASEPDSVRASLREIQDRVATLPGVQSVSVGVGALPLTAYTSVSFWRDGEARPSLGDLRYTLLYVVGPDYLRTMGIPLLRGRSFARQDDSRGARVAMIDEELARSIYPNQDAVGKRIRFNLFDQPVEVIGVVGHVKHSGLDADAAARIRFQLYMPTMQLPDNIAPLAANAVNVVVRTGAPMANMLGSIRKAITAFDSGQAISNEQAMDEVIANSLASRRFSLVVLGMFAGTALVLAVVGLYGVISYLVGQRTHEIGIRMALGAEPRDIRQSVLTEGARLALVGIGLGLVASLGLTRVIAGLLFGVTPTDFITFASVSGLLLTVTLVACDLPARRATKVSPMVALRYE